MNNSDIKVHPYLARQIADHVTGVVLHSPRFNQTHPGVFVEPTGLPEAVIVLGAAPISAPGAAALRACKELMEFLVVQYPERPPRIQGPRYSNDVMRRIAIDRMAPGTISEEDLVWMEVLGAAIAETRDVNCVLSTFEVYHANTPIQLANLVTASALIGANLPFEVEPVNNRPFRLQFEDELAKTMEEAA